MDGWLEGKHVFERDKGYNHSSAGTYLMTWHKLESAVHLFLHRIILQVYRVLIVYYMYDYFVSGLCPLSNVLKVTETSRNYFHQSGEAANHKGFEGGVFRSIRRDYVHLTTHIYAPS
jgi:hypothetical protein